MYAFDNCCSLTLRFNHWVVCSPTTKTQTINSEMLKNTSTIYGNHFASLKTSEFIRLFSRLWVRWEKSQSYMIRVVFCCLLCFTSVVYLLFLRLVQKHHASYNQIMGRAKRIHRKEGGKGALRNERERASERVRSQVQTNSNAQMKYLKSDIKK